MKTNIFILHGSFGHPFENWIPTTFAALGEKGVKTIVPHFPTPDGQTFANWMAVMDAYDKASLLNSDSVIVAHSSACPFALKYASRKRGQFNRLITVSGFNNYHSGVVEFDAINAEFYQSDQELADSKNYFSRIDSMYSDNDPYVPADVLKSFGESIGATHHLIQGAGHFNTDAGYRDFPELLKILRR